jgi:hypothetical protein
MSSGGKTEQDILDEQMARLTPSQQALYKSRRASYFKGTIAVCVIYGTLSLFLFVLAIASVKGRELLANDLLSFTVTFIAGMILIIIVLTLQVLNFKPPNYTGEDPAAMVCPDYWTLKETPKYVLDNVTNSEEKYLMQYMCQNDRSGVMPAREAAQTFATTAALPVSKKLKEKVASVVYGAQGNDENAGRLNCNLVFPTLMAVKDRKEFPEVPNSMRCQYAKTCGVSWTEACPEIPTADA